MMGCAYYFALVELSWFINPVLFMITSVWVVLILNRREYHSRTLKLLKVDGLLTGQNFLP